MEHAIGRLADIPPGEGRAFEVGGEHFAVFHTRTGQVFATQAYCPHAGGPLVDGLTDERTVMCPLHDRIYDFATGEGLGNECSISVYPVRADADGTLLLIAEPAGALAPAE